jgi:hypothetical protein
VKKNRPIFLAILVLVLITGAAYAAYKKDIIKDEDLQKLGLKKETIEKVAKDADVQTKALSKKAKEVGGHASEVLGDSIQVNDENKTPIHQKTFEYARYLYCQQAIKDYESQYK